MNEWLNEWRTDGMNAWMNDWMKEWMVEWMIEWMNGGMDEWMDDWMEELTDWLTDWENEKSPPPPYEAKQKHKLKTCKQILGNTHYSQGITSPTRHSNSIFECMQFSLSIWKTWESFAQQTVCCFRYRTWRDLHQKFTKNYWWRSV